MSFQSERSIKATRSPRRCDFCQNTIPAKSPAISIAGKHDGDFFSSIGHVDCSKMWASAYRAYADWDEGMPFDLYEAICGDEGRELQLAELDNWRGRFPHVVCRIELRMQLSDQRAIDRHRAAGFEPDLEPWEVLHS